MNTVNPPDDADVPAPESRSSAVDTVTRPDEGRTRRVVVLGSTGFVGSKVAAVVSERGVVVERPSARQLLPESVLRHHERTGELPPGALHELTEAIRGAFAVVNCAGLPDAASSDRAGLDAANGSLATLVARAVSDAAVPRLVHVSSAAVQGRAATLGVGGASPISPYSSSKLLGEQGVLAHAGAAAVVYRPPTVHGPHRVVSRRLVQLARSPLSSVAASGSRPTPVALIDNVADAVVFLTLHEGPVPPCVSHPWEGLTCAELLRLLSGRQPRHVPQHLASRTVHTLFLLGVANTQLRVLARRLEMLWFGQAQETSWLTTSGWSPPAGPESWKTLGEAVARHASSIGAAGRTRPTAAER